MCLPLFYSILFYFILIYSIHSDSHCLLPSPQQATREANSIKMGIKQNGGGVGKAWNTLIWLMKGVKLGALIYTVMNLLVL